MFDWIVTPSGALLTIGLLLCLAGLSVVVIRQARRRGLASDDELPTQIIADAGEADAAAFLVALETSLRMPQRVPLHAGRETRLGRDRRSNTVTLNDISISRRHATISGRGENFYIHDENSRGGTFVNRRRLRDQHKVLLNHNDIIQFYTFTYQFVLSDAPTQVNDSEPTLSTRLDVDSDHHL